MAELFLTGPKDILFYFLHCSFLPLAHGAAHFFRFDIEQAGASSGIAWNPL